jgi:hypothetical protein
MVRNEASKTVRSASGLMLISGFLFAASSIIMWCLYDPYAMEIFVTENWSKHILIDDLTPNVGLYWCFFTHIFDK